MNNLPRRAGMVAASYSLFLSPQLIAETEAAEETLFPVPTLSGDLWERDLMTGDWGGTRRKLADGGIQLDVTLQNYLQGVADGGRDTGWEYSGSSDYRLKLDSGKAGWWPGGFIEVHGESYWGNTVNLRTGALMPVNTDYAMSAPDGSGTYLSHVVVTQFLSESLGVYLGKLDLTVGDSNAFAHGVGNEKFQNLAFSFNPVTLLTAPYSALGAGVLWIPCENALVTATAYDLEGDIGESGFDSVFDDGTGYNVEVQVTTSFMDKPGHHVLGATYADGDFAILSDPRILLPGFMSSMDDSSWNVYYNFDQYIAHDESNGTGWGVFGRVGIADEDTNPIPLFLSAGVGGTGIIPGRERDRFGVGLYWLEISEDFPGLVKALLEDDELGVELFYDAAITPWFRVAADLQIVDPVLKSADTAVVFGLRSTVTF